MPLLLLPSPLSSLWWSLVAVKRYLSVSPPLSERPRDHETTRPQTTSQRGDASFTAFAMTEEDIASHYEVLEELGREFSSHRPCLSSC